MKKSEEIKSHWNEDVFIYLKTKGIDIKDLVEILETSETNLSKIKNSGRLFTSQQAVILYKRLQIPLEFTLLGKKPSMFSKYSNIENAQIVAEPSVEYGENTSVGLNLEILVEQNYLLREMLSDKNKIISILEKEKRAEKGQNA